MYRIGFPVTRTRLWRQSMNCVWEKLVQTSVAEGASQRVARPGTTFCSSKTSGMRSLGGGAAHGHAGITAQTDDRGDVLVFQETFGGEITGEVLHDERDRLAHAAWQWPTGQGVILKACRRYFASFKVFATAGERDPHIADLADKLLEPRPVRGTDVPRCRRQQRPDEMAGSWQFDLGRLERGKVCVFRRRPAGQTGRRQFFFQLRITPRRRELHAGHANEGAQRGGNPEPHDDLVLRPAAQLKMMM